MVTFFLSDGRGLPMGEWELWRTCHGASDTGILLRDEVCVLMSGMAGRVLRPRTDAHGRRRDPEGFMS